VDGFYVPNGKQPKLLRTVRKLTAQMEALCKGKGKLGTGGMRSKLHAAKQDSEAGRTLLSSTDLGYVNLDS
jgi:glutamate 5-kinase